MKSKSVIGHFPCLASLVALLCFGAISGAYAIVPTIVAPNGNRNVEGNIDNGYPFNLDFFSVPSQRYQQLFDASQFSSIGAGGLITQLIFRPDAFTGSAFSSMLPDIQINLSTTSVSDDGLSSTFASNVGINDMVVFAGSLSLSSAFTGPSGGPKDFDIVINLTTPFFYDPSLGNLLMDVRNFGGGSTTIFDAAFVQGDGVSRVGANDVNATTADSDFIDTGGLITGFTIVPEPGSAAILILGGGLLLARFGWRRRSS